MALAEWLEQWLGQMSATLRPGTLEHYRRDMENHVVPYLGKKMLTQVTTVGLRKLYDSLKKNGRVKPRSGQNHGLSSTTVHGIHTTLHHAFRAAVEQGLIPTNPADEVDPPKVIRQPMNILNEEQLDTFMDTIKADPIWHDFFYTELTIGLRLGEICGLMWADFDGRAGTLHICRTLHREQGGRLVAGDTKTYAGTRKIVLPPSTAELLRARKKKSFSPWIFHDPLRPEAPVNPSSATLNVYAHVTDEMRRTAAAKIDQGIGKADPRAEAGTTPRNPTPSTFQAHKGQRRKAGTGCVTQINEKLWEGRYSPVWPDGKKRPRNVYTHSEEECEKLLAEMITETKAEIAAEKERLKVTQKTG